MYNSIMCPFKSKQYEYSKRFHFYDAVFYPFYNLVVRNVSNQVNIHAEFRQQKNSRKLEENIFEIMKGKMDGKKMWMFKLQRKKKKKGTTRVFSETAISIDCLSSIPYITVQCIFGSMVLVKCSGTNSESILF